MPDLFWAKVKPEAIIPQKRREDAGYDLYACFEDDYLQIDPGKTVLVPLGIATAFDPEWVMILKERSSTAKLGLSLRAGVIDSGYRGEYLAAISNISDTPVRIVKESQKQEIPGIVNYPYEKAICQGVLLQMPDVQSREVSYEELMNMKSQRGTGLMGSSGK